MPETDEIIASFGEEFDATKVPDGMLRAVRFPTLMWVDKRTPDGRLIMRDGFVPGAFPKSFMFQFKYLPAHLESVPIGRIDRLDVHKSGKVEAWGWILDNEDGQRAALLIATKSQRGVSVDLSARKVEYDYDPKTERLQINFVESGLRGATGVAFPAFPDAKAMSDSFGDIAAAAAALPEVLDFGDVDDDNLASSIAYDTDDLAAAAGVDVKLPVLRADHFENPSFDEATPVRVNAEGRIFGHIATWGTCHVGIEGRCVTPPRSRSDYALFATRLAALDNGESVWVGPLVLGAKHAPGHLDYAATAEYYGNACRAWADVAIGEDAFGIWISGSVRPGTSTEDIHAGTMAAVSGHWKPYKGSMELISVLSVNAPGFPVPRPKAFADESGLVDLVAAGVMEPAPVSSDVASGGLAAAMQALADEMARERARREADRIVAELERSA